MAQYINEREVAKMTGLAVQTLRNHRHLRTGIPYIKATSRAVRYSVKDVTEFMEKRRIQTDDLR